ncbi:hypothetical protein PSTH1771_24220 [Pseudomonas syringae pv. theae]|uniref:hypothetical protein n=1 Tax=Pseudomonas syringae TaxID=317 RepID=UPI0023D307CA|nr:hypothetical protein [Pseudomonas syringae]GKS08182.1 hypothetical protein PSTH1771_24220 [Pseudomonas syringae pv. theae]
MKMTPVALFLMIQARQLLILAEGRGATGVTPQIRVFESLLSRASSLPRGFIIQPATLFD